MSHSHHATHDPSERIEAPESRGAGPRSRFPSACVGVFVALIDLYRRLVSPVLPPSCRFVPSCSQYAQVALRRHGLLRGVRLAAARILRCGPWSPGGFDPVQ